MTLPAGTVVGEYTIERVLGSGGMGTVYLARHPVLPRSDALKVLPTELSVDPEFRARFLREADLAAGLDHPNIVRVYSRGDSDAGQLWIAMQFVDGTDAGAELRTGPMAAERTAHIISQIARALDYAHSRGIVHRDLKPANFLLSGPVGPRERVLLADFGIARALNESTRLTATGAMVATVAYAAPEVVEGRPADYRADIYSLGCTLYRLLTNKAPFAGAGPMSAVMLAHVQQPPPRVTDTMPGLPPAINAVVAKAMAKDPAARHHSARELATDAAAALGHPDLTELVAPLAPRRDPPPAWSTSPTATAYPAPPSTWAPTPTTPAQPKRRRRMAWIAVGTVTAVVAASVVAITWNSGPDEVPYRAQTFVHTFGTTTLAQRPTAVAALTLSDADTALSLGAQPVAISTGTPAVPGWLKTMIHTSPAIIDTIASGPIAAAKPDVIIDTAADQQAYTTLSAIASTITRPADPTTAWSAAAQIAWVGRILGTDDAATTLQNQAAVDQAKIRQDNPGFAAKSAAVVLFSDSGLSVALSESPAAAYLSGLGFVYASALASTVAGQLDKPVQADALTDLATNNLIVVIRTDAAGAAGGFNGLPPQLTNAGGNIVVVGDPDTISALTSGGPAATHFLNTTFVDTIAAKLR
jgi:serine/threonine protein kinase